MSTANNDKGFVSASTGVVARPSTATIAQHDPQDYGTPARVSFEPWGHRKVGDPDPEAKGYQRLDGYAFDARALSELPDGPVTFIDVSGRKFILAAGAQFVCADGIDGDLPLDPALTEYTTVIGAEAGDGEGYVAVGVNPALMIAE